MKNHVTFRLIFLSVVLHGFKICLSYEGITWLQLLENGMLRRKFGLKMTESKKKRGKITQRRDSQLLLFVYCYGDSNKQGKMGGSWGTKYLGWKT